MLSELRLNLQDLIFRKISEFWQTSCLDGFNVVLKAVTIIFIWRIFKQILTTFSRFWLQLTVQWRWACLLTEKCGPLTEKFCQAVWRPIPGPRPVATVYGLGGKIHFQRGKIFVLIISLMQNILSTAKFGVTLLLNSSPVATGLPSPPNFGSSSKLAP